MTDQQPNLQQNDAAQQVPSQAGPTDRNPDTGRGPRAVNPLLSVAVVLVVVAVVVVATLPSWLVSPLGVRQYLRRALPELQGDVKVEEASLGWFTPLAIKGISLVPDDDGPPPLSIEAIDGDRGLFAILSERGQLGRIDISGLKLDLVFDEQHVSNLQRLVGRLHRQPATPPTIPADPPTPPAAATAAAEERVRVVVAGARVGVRGPWTSTPWESDPIDIEAALRRTAAGEREWSLKPLTLLDHARLEPSVAAGVLAYAAPILADATRTSGEFSLVIDEARWPAGRGEDATVSGTLTLHEVDIGPGPLVDGLIRSLPGRLPSAPTIRVAEASRVQFRQSSRRVWHKGLAFGLPLAEQGQRLDIESSGSVGLDDRSVDMTLSLPIPADLPQDRPLLAAIAGKTLQLRVGGSLEKPKIKFDDSLKQTVTAVAGDVLENLRQQREKPPQTEQGSPLAPEANPTSGGKMSEPAEAAAAAAADADQRTPTGTAAKLDQLKGLLPPEVSADPATDKVIDAVGGLLDEVARRRATRKQKAAPAKQGQADDQPPAKRKRPARRLLQQLLDAADSASAGSDAPAASKPKEKPQQDAAKPSAAEPPAD